MIVKFLILIYMYTQRLLRSLVRDEDAKRRLSIGFTSIMCRLGLNALKVRTEVDNREGLHSEGGCLIVSNHMSYIDILLISSQRPAVFVSTKEVEEDPYTGTLAALGGTVFIERRSASRIREEIEMLAELMRKGFAVVIFPEGTTTNGENILPFRAPFIEAAKKAGVPVIPVCINYKTVNGERFSPKNRDLVCWYGDMEFEPHFNDLVKQKEITAQINVLNPVSSEGMRRKELGELLHRNISEIFVCN
ncbi:lysophospholipid acyltransferase family protein [Limisalsivibrio acetivorans]|uniref:lysophospholipid acyltransferase family protein n=1 Tax=Limisalsivibrio acetivorans TaxID=1304888 RepID=UPI00138B065E|nr:lysophospholipid acyltransferase family protein [Limisalsivibrio acetivorans]